MKSSKSTILVSFAAFFMGATPAFSDHIPQYLIDGVFYEMELSWCIRDAECVPEEFTPNTEYAVCMKEILHDDYTRERLENMLNYKNANGDFSDYELEEYDFNVDMAFWLGC